MAEFSEVLKNRRSVRTFTDEPVAEKDLHAVLEAIQWSPSWANTQCWEVVVVKDDKIKEQLAETLPKGNPAKKGMAAAPVVLAVAGRKNEAGYYKGAVTTKLGDWYMFDLGICAQSMWLRAKDLGLGTVVVGLFDHDAASRILGVPENMQLVFLAPLGHPAKEPKAPERKKIQEFTRTDRF
ncbi:MAG: nitroreductase family protein [Deltaproteobacteria bacterium]|nr:nitroreductase family protein [Deltaproteobacteria bacterium]